MKKISMLFLCLLTMILIAGCDTEDKVQTLICKNTETDDGMSIEQVISMTYKNDKLQRMTMEANTKITDSDVKENWDEFKKSMDEQNKEFNKDGVSLKVEKNDQDYEYKTILDVDIENASDEVLEEQRLEDLKNDNSTLKSSKESAEKDGDTCEVK